MNIMEKQSQRYFESPHLITETIELGQIPFNKECSVNGGIELFKENFTVHTEDVIDVEKFKKQIINASDKK